MVAETEPTRRTDLSVTLAAATGARPAPAVPAWAAPGRGPAAILRRYRALAMGLDLLAGAVAAACATLLRFGSDPGPTYVAVSVLAPVLWFLAIASRRGYENRFLGAGPEEYRNLADAALMLFIVVAVASFAFKGGLSRAFIVGFIPLAFVLTLLGRRRLRFWLYGRRLSGDGMHRVVVVGQGAAVSHVVEQFDREPGHGLATVGVCISGGQVPLPPDVIPRTDANPRSVLRMVDDLRADVVAVASNPDLSGHALRRLAWALDERGVDLIVSPGIVEVAGPRLSIRPVAGLSLLHLERPSTRGGRMLIKRVLDRLLGSVLFVVLSPLLAAIALAIRWTSPGPVLFRQFRIGEDGRPFEMLKFRSMVVDAEDRRAELEGGDDGNGVLFKMRRDPRVTRVGRRVAALLAGRAAAAVERRPRGHVAGRAPASAAPGGRRVLGRRHPPAPRAPRDDGAVAGQRSQRPLVGGVRPARPALRRQLVAGPRRAHPLAHRRAVLRRDGAY